MEHTYNIQIKLQMSKEMPMYQSARQVLPTAHIIESSGANLSPKYTRQKQTNDVLTCIPQVKQ